MPEEFLTIPPTNEENGFTGYHLSPQIKDGYKSEVAWWRVMELLSISDEGDASPAAGSSSDKPAASAAIEEWGEEEAELDYLPDWEDEECRALGIAPVRDIDGAAVSSASPDSLPKASPPADLKDISRDDVNQ
jgi:hypothetical protein